MRALSFGAKDASAASLNVEFSSLHFFKAAASWICRLFHLEAPLPHWFRFRLGPGAGGAGSDSGGAASSSSLWRDDLARAPQARGGNPERERFA